jgi:hypothetical protein
MVLTTSLSIPDELDHAEVSSKTHHSPFLMALTIH